VTGFDEITSQATAKGLMVAGIAAVDEGDGLAPGIRSILLLAPDEPRFWPLFRQSDEYSDGRPDALDRWSRRVIGGIACSHGAKAYFPFGGPPYRPFLSWAIRSGRCWASPVGLLVHDTAGLFISFRGAIGLAGPAQQETAASPCETCIGKPCQSACPVGALTPQGYDVPACKAWLETSAGAVCHGGGCLVRRACPVGATRRLADQSAYHMRAFHSV
jgi:epoxyqueuosine reductase